ncbi:hypothetical protein DFH06DRAFT_1301689 [Mycena polygramma]|nr:hypothetical protein DFH06DRAFT_1301689 [Mycena polygramma]
MALLRLTLASIISFSPAAFAASVEELPFLYRFANGLVSFEYAACASQFITPSGHPWYLLTDQYLVASRQDPVVFDSYTKSIKYNSTQSYAAQPLALQHNNIKEALSQLGKLSLSLEGQDSRMTLCIAFRTVKLLSREYSKQLLMLLLSSRCTDIMCRTPS